MENERALSFHEVGPRNIADLVRNRQEGRIPPTRGAYASGGAAGARAARAGARAGGGSFGFQRNVVEHPSMIEKLQNTATLRGHSRCVNRLCWNERGTTLASGSDDTTVCLFDATSTRCKLKFRTGHRRNIFGIKILPNTDDQIIVTGAMDFDVRLHMAPFSSDRATRCFSCHGDRVKDVEVEPGNPFLFWSASEDGTIRQFDRRMSQEGCRNEPMSQERAAGFRERGSRFDPGNCLVALTSGPEDYLPSFGRLGVNMESVRAMKIVCNPTDINYLAVACGDLVVRVFDRRTLSMGSAENVRSWSKTPAMLFSPAHEHPFAGKAYSRSSFQSGISTFGVGHHSTCVKYSPDGRGLLVSYHRDHVYLFDASGARRTSDTRGGDRALSSYFLPDAPSSSSPALAPTGLGAFSTKRWDGGGGGGSSSSMLSGKEGRGAKKGWHKFGRKGALDRTPGGRRPRGFRCRRVTRGERADIGVRLLEAHRALAQWDGRGPPPLSASTLSTLYRERCAELQTRNWRGDRYIALLDAARAKELAPADSEAQWTYLQALLSVERKSIATREALHTLQAFPELESRIEELISPTTLPRGTLARAASSSHGIIAYGAQGASGGAARQRSDDNRPGRGRDKRHHAESDEEEEEDEKEEEDNDGQEEEEEEEEDDDDDDEEDEDDSEEGGANVETNTRAGFRTPPRRVRIGAEFDTGLGRDLSTDRLLEAEERAAAAWYWALSGYEKEVGDTRCRGKSGGYPGGCNEEKSSRPFPRPTRRANGSSVTRSGAKEQVERERPVRGYRTQLDKSVPEAMIQRYVGACNVQTDIKEACFWGDNGEYIVAGSDDGRLFIWERVSGRLVRAVRAVRADDRVLNCVEPHPSLPILATSGLDSVVRLWSPLDTGGKATGIAEELGEHERDRDGGSGRESFLEDIARSNQSDMDAVGISMNMSLQPLMHQLIVQITAGGEDGGRESDGPGDCTQA